MPEYNDNLRVKFNKDTLLVPVMEQLGWANFPQAVNDQENLPAHIHSHAYEICYITCGSVEWFIEDKSYEINAGNIFITAPGEKHGGRFGIMNPCELFWLQIVFPEDAEFSGLSRLESSFIARQYANIQQRVMSATPEVVFYFRQLIDEHRNPDQYSKIITKNALLGLIINVIKISNSHSGNNYSSEICQACAFIDENFEFEIKNEDIARKVNLSLSSFYQRFATQVGMTPREYIIQQRIHRARQLLCQSDLSITQIAHTVGFSSSQYFATFFKKLTGLSPGQYKSQINKV